MVEHQDQALLDEIKSRVPVSQVAARHVVLKRAGREYVGLSPFKTERTASFTVNDEKGFYHCFATGENGDAFDLLMKLEGLRFVEAKAVLANMAGISLPGSGGISTATGEKYQKQAARRNAEATEREEQARRTYHMRALEIWERAQRGEGSMVERYLLARDVDLSALFKMYGYRVPRTLRFVPQLYHSRDRHGEIIAPPGMVAAIQDAERHVMAIHRTWLSDDGLGKAFGKASKKTFSSYWGGGIRLSPVADHCLIGEGLETTLKVMAELARVGVRVFGLCGVSLGNIAGRGRKSRCRRGEAEPKYITEPDMNSLSLVLPKGIKRVTLCSDADGKDPTFGRAMMERASHKFRRSGYRDVRIADPWIGCDFNDMVR